MSGLPKKTIKELLMRYKLEPGLLDVYVEGGVDRDILTSAGAEGSLSDRVIYPIDCVEINQDDLNELELSNGNKQRVIALASKLSSVGDHAKYLCLIDRDLDHWFSDHPTIPRLKWTKFCSIESHFITLDALKEIVVLAGRAKVSNIEDLFQSTIDVLQSLYSLRLADHELELKLSWVPLKKYLKQGESSVALEFDAYVRALLNKNGKMAEMDAVIVAAEQWMSKFTDEHRLSCRGHDFTDLLAWIVPKLNGVKGFGDSEVISRTFVLAARGKRDVLQEIDFSEK